MLCTSPLHSSSSDTNNRSLYMYMLWWTWIIQSVDLVINRNCETWQNNFISFHFIAFLYPTFLFSVYTCHVYAVFCLGTTIPPYRCLCHPVFCHGTTVPPYHCLSPPGVYAVLVGETSSSHIVCHTSHGHSGGSPATLPRGTAVHHNF